jgi:hypothetical protein
MPIYLKNDDLSVRVERAGEKYRGSRFDWNGLVSQIAFGRTTFGRTKLLGQEKPPLQRNPRIFGRGLHNEFGIKKCLGYEECPVGEVFPKIGVGWLRRDDKPYFFYTQYPIEPIEFDVETSGKTGAVFSCDSLVRNGWGYRYVKRISLEDATVRIGYTLENTGSKAIETDEYVHNFLCFGNRRVDEGYSLSFPWKLDPTRFAEVKDPEGILRMGENRIDFIDQTDEQFYVGGISDGVTEADGLAARWTLSDASRKIGLTETGSFMPSAVHLWGWKRVISPELFFAFRLEPGNIVSWERVYSVTGLSSST